MHITYDKEADAAYISLQDDKVHTSVEADNNTVIDYDKEGRVVGIEILDASTSNPEIIKQAQIIRKLKELAGTQTAKKASKQELADLAKRLYG